MSAKPHPSRAGGSTTMARTGLLLLVPRPSACWPQQRAWHVARSTRRSAPERRFGVSYLAPRAAASSTLPSSASASALPTDPDVTRWAGRRFGRLRRGSLVNRATFSGWFERRLWMGGGLLGIGVLLVAPGASPTASVRQRLGSPDRQSRSTSWWAGGASPTTRAAAYRYRASEVRSSSARATLVSLTTCGSRSPIARSATRARDGSGDRRSASSSAGPNRCGAPTAA